ncbi:hypothetical protein TWF217_011363 [Orbilia oligospora]|nr:hypothetical protein TWF217_011363 [Orbilia oligospora]
MKIFVHHNAQGQGISMFMFIDIDLPRTQAEISIRNTYTLRVECISKPQTYEASAISPSKSISQNGRFLKWDEFIVTPHGPVNSSSHRSSKRLSRLWVFIKSDLLISETSLIYDQDSMS